MGNKLKKEDVEAYLGPDWENILIRSNHFNKRFL